jgi:hypothetical protein
MRAREFTINVPINIRINGDGDPEIDAAGEEEGELDQNPVMLTPLQQDLELRKAEQGKKSPYIDSMLDDDPTVGAEANRPADRKQPRIR